MRPNGKRPHKQRPANGREQGRNDETELVNISLVAFGDNAERLLRYKKRDDCYVIGTLGFTRWKPNGSAEPEQRFQLVLGRMPYAGQADAPETETVGNAGRNGANAEGERRILREAGGKERLRDKRFE